MKKLDYSYITSSAAQPIKQGTLKHIQEAFQEPLDFICSAIFGVTSGVNVLYGCVNSTAVGTTYTVSAGAVYYSGEVFLVDAVTATRSGNVLVATIATTYYVDATADPVTFTDLVTHNVHTIRKVSLALGVSGSGIADYTAFNSDRWHTIGSTYGEVTEPAFQNSWANTGSVRNVARFKKDKGGWVCLGGLIAGGSSGTTAFTLPLGFRPAKRIDFFAQSSLGNPVEGLIDTSGDIILSYSSGGTATLENIRFPLD